MMNHNLITDGGNGWSAYYWLMDLQRCVAALKADAADPRAQQAHSDYSTVMRSRRGMKMSEGGDSAYHTIPAEEARENAASRTFVDAMATRRLAEKCRDLSADALERARSEMAFPAASYYAEEAARLWAEFHRLRSA